MTYKSSYFKLCLEDMKRRLVIVIVTLALFLGYGFLFTLSMLSEIVFLEDMTRGAKIFYVAEMCVPSSFECVLAMLMGVFLAAQGFQFLHSKRKMDFYGALPISRGRRYAVLCTNQLVLFTIPLLVVKGMEMLVVFASGFGSGEAYLNIVNSTICLWFSFLAMWAITSFMVIATGHLALSLAGTAIISIYVPLCRFVIFEGYCNLLLDTYVSTEPAAFWYALSPFSVLSKLMPELWADPVKWTWKDNGVWLPVLVIYAIVFGVAAYLLYMKRQNEAAGRAMAFPKGNRIVQVLLVVPCGLLSGLVTSILVSWINVWLVVPFVIISCCFVHMLLECIFHYNIRKVFLHKWQMIITTAVTVCMVLLIGLDVVGYDSYLPKAEEVRAIYVTTNQGEDWMNVEQIDKNVEMSDELKTNILTFVEPLLHVYEVDLQDKMENPTHLSLDSFISESYYSVEVAYVTNSGEINQRCYDLPEDYDLSGFMAYYNMKEYREIVSESKWDCLENITGASWVDTVSSVELNLTDEEIKELFAIYREEYYAVPWNSAALGEISVAYMDDYALAFEGVEETYETFESFYVYEDCTETIAYLESKGIDVFTMDECEIKELEIHVYDEEDWEKEEHITITDPAVIEKYRNRFQLCYYIYEYSNLDIYANNGVDDMDMIALCTDEETIKELLATKEQ